MRWFVIVSLLTAFGIGPIAITQARCPEVGTCHKVVVKPPVKPICRLAACHRV